MDIKITLVAPFLSMYNTAKEVIAERTKEWIGEVNVVLSEKLGGGIKEAQEEIARGTEVIISRGHTAERIEQHVDIPVTHIQVTATDIIQVLKQASDYHGRVGVLGFSGVVYECEKVGELLGISICDLPAKDDIQNVREVIRAAIDDGITIIVGDFKALRVAREFNVTGILIESSKNAIYKAIKEAETIALVRRKEQERAKLLNTIIELSTDGIVVVDKQTHITVFNSLAQTIFQKKASQVIGKPVTAVIKDTQLDKVVCSGIAQTAEIQHIGQKIVATKRIPIVVKQETVGAIATFQDVTQLQRFEQMIRQKLHRKGLFAKNTLDNFIGCSKKIQLLKQQTRQFAQTDSTILITGESGTGKEMLAQSIHNASQRKLGPFLAVNCAALPENLLESELFGYEEGAFTGTRKGGKPGLFELAHGGTLFLDEIAEMPLALQSRLLRVLQEREVMRLGADRVIAVDVRIVAATNRDLEIFVQANRFRSDLYYRLNVLRLRIPPLRERPEDIPELVAYFLRIFSKWNPAIECISPQAVKLLQLHAWKGNVRELFNILERVMLLVQRPVITAADIGNLLPIVTSRPARSAAGKDIQSGTLQQLERNTIMQFLLEEKFNYTRVAERLGINRTTLWRKLKIWRDKEAAEPVSRNSS